MKHTEIAEALSGLTDGATLAAAAAAEKPTAISFSELNEMAKSGLRSYHRAGTPTVAEVAERLFRAGKFSVTDGDASAIKWPSYWAAIASAHEAARKTLGEKWLGIRRAESLTISDSATGVYVDVPVAAPHDAAAFVAASKKLRAKFSAAKKEAVNRRAAMAQVDRS